MALYEVYRTDVTNPGEFVSALVVAAGTAQARNAVLHLPGATRKNLVAKRVDTNGRNGARLIDTEFDERMPE